jgi:hypothetical protein
MACTHPHYARTVGFQGERPEEAVERCTLCKAERRREPLFVGGDRSLQHHWRWGPWKSPAQRVLEALLERDDG